MPPFVKLSEAVLFIHIPKTGGSSLSSMMTSDGWTELGTVRGIKADKLKFFKATPQHWDAHQLNAVYDISQFARIAAVVRHPFDRLKSEYYWHLKQGFTTSTPERWVRQVFDDFKINPHVFDNHIRPQTDFFVGGDSTSWFKFEEDGITRAFRHLCCYSADHRPKSLPTEKKSVRNDHIEAAFATLRQDIEKFYAEDMKRFGYTPG
jgi:hypothetical protein